MNESICCSSFLPSEIINLPVELAFFFEDAGHLNVTGLQDDFLSAACGNNNGVLKQLIRLTS